jgi:hypothetical protein
MRSWAEGPRSDYIGKTLWKGHEHPPRPELMRFEGISKRVVPLGTIFCLGLGTIASMRPGQKWRIP